MRILKQLTRKKNAFFRGIKFNLIKEGANKFLI